jgi:hypothetical protein
MDNLQKLAFIKASITKTNCNNKFAKKAKQNRIKYYTENVDKLIQINIEKIQSHNFNIEVIEHAFNLEKLNYIDKKVFNKIKCIEVHKYAPELNKIIFKNNTEIKAPQVINMEQATLFLLNRLSLEQLKEI